MSCQIAVLDGENSCLSNLYVTVFRILGGFPFVAAWVKHKGHDISCFENSRDTYTVKAYYNVLSKCMHSGTPIQTMFKLVR